MLEGELYKRTEDIAHSYKIRQILDEAAKESPLRLILKFLPSQNLDTIMRVNLTDSEIMETLKWFKKWFGDGDP